MTDLGVRPFTVTTANVHMSEAIRSPWTTEKLAGNDILCMQEVLDIEQTTLERNLGHIGLTLAAHNTKAGLVIAASDRFRVVRSDYWVLRRNTSAEFLARMVGLQTRFRERGMLFATLEDTETNGWLTVATAHPIVGLRFRARKQQIETMTKLMQRRHQVGPFILAADMNHYPGPHEVDRKMAEKNRLRPIKNTDPTVHLDRTRHAWLQRFGFPDARLDTVLFRKLSEHQSDVFPISSDHEGVRAGFTFS